MKKYSLFFGVYLMAVLYGSFLGVDVHGGFSSNLYSKTVRYLSILTCLVFVFAAGKDAIDEKDLRLMKWAFVLTACADFTISMICNYSFLAFGFCSTFGNIKFGLGMVLFLIVQILYIIRHKQNFSWNWKEVITAVVIFGIMAIKVVQQGNTLLRGGGVENKIIFAVAVCYAITLCFSVWMAIGTIWRHYFPKTTSWFIAIGLVLFFLCDNNLGRTILYPDTVPISEMSAFVKIQNKVNVEQLVNEGDMVTVSTNVNQTRHLEIPFTLKTISGILVWFFYLPAQVLLMLSSYHPHFLKQIFGLITVDEGD